MFSQSLKEKYQFLTDYFEQGLKNPNRNIAHSILFYGQDIEAQYELATEIARLLNCQKLHPNSHSTFDDGGLGNPPYESDEIKNCNCLNCNWVREGSHPAVLTISKIDNKPSDDESKTVISVKQTQMLKTSLLNTSDYHRVFIFCDAQIIDGIWTPSGLNQVNFQAETANSLLKIIEEPPQNTMFFFLTRDKNDLLETIISRSQSFFVPSFKTENKDFSNIETVFADYLTLERQNSIDLAQDLFTLSKEQGCENVLTQIQNYLLALLKSNMYNNLAKLKILDDIKHVELAKKMINNHITPQLALEDMCLNFTQQN